MMFTFVVLCQDHKLRSSTSFSYVMIDEFQDTNEIQLKLAMLLSSTGNICAVGDWKQSIFAFQYASVENILEFGNRLNDYKYELNSDFRRINYPVCPIEEIYLSENYRSSQSIIDFSQGALLLKYSNNEIRS